MLALGPPENWSVGQRDTVIDALDRAVAKHPDRILLDIGGDFFTYGDIDRLSTRLANALGKLGVRQAETVVTMLDNNQSKHTYWRAHVTPAHFPGQPDHWVIVPDEKIVPGANPTGSPILWLYNGLVQCFAPPDAF